MRNSKLSLLQYNVQKSQSVQDLLLTTLALQEVDIIALQKPWKNPHLETSTSTAFSSFIPLYSLELGRTLFLINKKLRLSSLHPTFWSKDFISLEIYLENSTTSLWVHNLYFTPSSQRNYTEASDSLLLLLQTALQERGQHILLTDSNLHHVAVHTIPPDQVRLIGSMGLDSGLVLVERSVKEWVGVLRDSACGLL